MTGYFRAVAIDYDGTLVEGGPPDAKTLDALAAVRDSNRKLVLVTGRILGELREVFPAVDVWFDAVVAENGGVLAIPDGPVYTLASAVSPTLDRALDFAAIPSRRGQVLLEIDAEYGGAAMSLIGGLELDCQILRNRGAAMILPIGVSKATGLARALDKLGLSPHNCVGIGDAENDHALLDACEIGVAAPGALLSLRAHADVVLARGELPGLLTRIARDDLAGVDAARWRLELGHDGEEVVTLPASRANLSITGPPGSGKSYLAGLLCEQLLELGYSSLVLDLEGDHVGLSALGRVIVVGGDHLPPEPDELPALLRHHVDSTLVVDLSGRPDEMRRTYARRALAEIQHLRDECGLPQWVVVEEAHLPLGVGTGETELEFDQKGICLVTYRPDDIAARCCDAVIALELEGPATLAWRDQTSRAFVPASRDTAHVRHLHKYEHQELPEHRRFFFRDGRGLTGRVAGSLLRFRDDLEASSLDVLRHHARSREISRWIRDVLLDVRLANQIRGIEASVDSSGSEREVAMLKRELVSLIGDHCGVAA